MNEEIVLKNIKILKNRSLIGLSIFVIGALLGFLFMKNIIGAGFSLVFLLLGWYIFSLNHARKCSLEIKYETQKCLNNFKNKK